MDQKSGAHTDRPGLGALLGYARTGDVIVVHALDQLAHAVHLRDAGHTMSQIVTKTGITRNLTGIVTVDYHLTRHQLSSPASVRQSPADSEQQIRPRRLRPQSHRMVEASCG